MDDTTERRPGRPKGRSGRRLNLYLPPEVIATLEELGGGSASAGVQVLVDRLQRVRASDRATYYKNPEKYRTLARKRAHEKYWAGREPRPPGLSQRVPEMKADRDAGMTWRQIGEKYGVNPLYASRVCRGVKDRA